MSLKDYPVLDVHKFTKLVPTGTETIVFTDKLCPKGVIKKFLSKKKDESIIGWSEGNTYYVSKKKKDVKIKLPHKSNNMFSGEINSAFRYVSVIKGLENLDLSETTNINHMFSETGMEATSFTLEGIDQWDTRHVVFMCFTFSYTGQNAKTVDISGIDNWPLSSVTDMHGMFWATGQNAVRLNLGDLSKWDVSKVSNMCGMFTFAGEKAKKMKLPIESWKTVRATNMKYMLNGTGTLSNIQLDLSKWDVTHVKKYDNFLNVKISTRIIPPNFVM